MSILDLFKLDGQTALVTGCRREHRTRSSRKHWPRPERISLASALHSKQTPKSAKDIAERGKRFTGYACDFSDRQAVRAFVEQVKRRSRPNRHPHQQRRYDSARSWLRNMETKTGTTSSRST